MACQLLTGGHLWHFDKVCFRPKAADGHCPVSGTQSQRRDVQIDPA